MKLKFLPCLLLLCALACQTRQSWAQPARGFKIVVAQDAPPEVKAAAQKVVQAATAQPRHGLLGAMEQSAAPPVLHDSKALLAGKLEERAYSHLILVGMPQDPAIEACWQREARIEGGGLYSFGWGHFRGDIGFVESGRNPFLHSAALATAPFETEVVTLTGTSPSGVALAVEAFIGQGLLHGVVMGPGATRLRESLLDRDPLPAGFTTGMAFPKVVQDAILVGVTAGAADELRGVLADTEVEPLSIWRARYYLPGSWDAKGAAGAFSNFGNGLDRRAYGNTLWVGRFASPEIAAQAAPKIAGRARLGKVGTYWNGQQPPFADGKYFGDQPSSGPLRLWFRGNCVFMSTLPVAVTQLLQTQELSAP